MGRFPPVWHNTSRDIGSTKDAACSTSGSNGVPKRGPPAESRTGEPLGPWPAPIAKQTAQLPRSTFHPSPSPQPRACNAWTSPIRGRWPPCPSWLSKELPHQRQRHEVVVRRNSPTRLSVMSTASWVPPKHGRSWAKTSMRRSSLARTHTFMSLRNALYLTRAPTSLQIRANMRSVGVARFLSRPVLGQAARWCPFRSRSSWHPLHRASVTGNGKASRSSNNTRKRCGGTVHSGAVGAWDKAMPALCPECDLK